MSNLSTLFKKKYLIVVIRIKEKKIIFISTVAIVSIFEFSSVTAGKSSCSSLSHQEGAGAGMWLWSKSSRNKNLGCSQRDFSSSSSHGRPFLPKKNHGNAPAWQGFGDKKAGIHREFLPGNPLRVELGAIKSQNFTARIKGKGEKLEMWENPKYCPSKEIFP